MKELRGKVAVVTGAASGIGRALAERFAREGMRVVLADVDAAGLAEAERALRASGAEALGVPTDVTRADAVSALAERTLDAFGGVHVVCNNAGVFAAGPSWQAPLSDYEFVLGVNVWGVIHGIRTFVPILLERGEEGHVVNTASMAALTSMPLTGAYTMSKHAVLALSETLYHELRGRGAKVGVSALCPEAIATGIGHSERVRPPHLSRKTGEADGPEFALVESAIRTTIAKGLAPARIAERVVAAIREERFYVLPEDDPWLAACEVRSEDIRLRRNPTLAVPVG
ncbi:MAG TPA: SDR family NAD(P)-dependent oxidoreductase [Myxococcota bacterium]|nr:SDR family NAD(P)-dependent oxidoreductase [Myxococcota bacterium]